MDRAEAHKLAHDELKKIEQAGYAIATEHVDTAALKVVSSPTGTTYEIELSYHWKDTVHDEILVICRVTSKKWFTHEHIEEAITLDSGTP